MAIYLSNVSNFWSFMKTLSSMELIGCSCVVSYVMGSLYFHCAVEPKLTAWQLQCNPVIEIIYDH